MQILTPADFALINDLQIQAATKAVESGGGSAAKRKLASLQANKKAASSSGAGDAPTFVSESDILGPRKKAKADYEERMASIARGREGREKFGSLKGKRKKEMASSSTNREKARNILASLREASKIHFVSAFDMAAVFAGMGEKDNAFHWLEKAYSGRESQMAFLGITRRMNGVRSDPRYSDLLRRMHLNAPIASN